MRTMIALLAGITISAAQTTYTIPFDSKGNTIELAVANTSTLQADQVKVEVTDCPNYITFTKKTLSIQQLKPQEEQTATFSFNVEKMAVANKEETLKFTVTSQTGQQWTKDITIQIAPPDKYELYQNYPNPFNPTTTITYQLTAISKVSIKIYDMLGRQVAEPMDEQQEAGGHEMTFNASRLSSGVYFYQLVAVDARNTNHIFRKKMMVVK